MNVETFRYDNRVVRAFCLATAFWGLIGTSVGLLAACQLFWPGLNLELPFTTFGRIRPLHTNAVVFAFVGNGMFMGFSLSYAWGQGVLWEDEPEKAPAAEEAAPPVM